MKHLDASYLIDLLREGARGSGGPATAFLERIGEEGLRASVHVFCELYAGAELSRDSATERQRVDEVAEAVDVVLPDERFAATYAELWAELRRRGRMIATMDLLIATAAVVDEAALVTRNVDDFEQVPGLRVISY